MREKIKNIDLFIRVVNDNTNEYVTFPAQYHKDYMSYTLSFSFEDWANAYTPEKVRLHYTAVYKNANDEILVKFQNKDFDTLCDEILKWNKSHRVDISDKIVRQIVHEQETNNAEYVEPQRKDEDHVRTLFDGIVNWFKK